MTLMFDCFSSFRTGAEGERKDSLFENVSFFFLTKDDSFHSLNITKYFCFSFFFLCQCLFGILNQLKSEPGSVDCGESVSFRCIHQAQKQNPLELKYVLTLLPTQSNCQQSGCIPGDVQGIRMKVIMATSQFRQEDALTNT